jgi:DNA-binding beta-propeller fold protein YncE
MQTPRVGSGRFVFDFDDQWASGHHDGTSDGWAHHGIAVTVDGRVVTFHERSSQVQVIDPGGSLLHTFAVELTEAHDLVIAGEDDQECLWICDNGSKRRRQPDGDYAPSPKPLRGAVVRYSLSGTEQLRLSTPDLDVYARGDYCPGALAVHEERFGGTGEIWVADCYGQSLVHHFDNERRYLDTLDGTAGAGRFHHPHAVHIDRRGPQPRLYIADRGNKRIQVFDLDGRFVRAFGEDYLLSPSGFAAYGDHLLVTELHSRIAVVGPDDELVTYLGAHDEAGLARPGWPNTLSAAGPVRPPLAKGEFNTPHGIATDADGNVYVSEWLIGGRLVKLTPVDRSR